MSKILNTVFGIIGATILGALFGIWTTLKIVGDSMNKENKIEDEWIAATLKTYRDRYRLFYH